jgi:predicted DNA-binding protein (UPF0251 family)
LFSSWKKRQVAADRAETLRWVALDGHEARAAARAAAHDADHAFDPSHVNNRVVDGHVVDDDVSLNDDDYNDVDDDEDDDDYNDVADELERQRQLDDDEVEARQRQFDDDEVEARQRQLDDDEVEARRLQLDEDEVEARRLQALENIKQQRRAEQIAAADDGRDVLREVRQSIPSFLCAQKTMDYWAFEFTSEEASPHALPGQPLYERFLAAWTETDLKVEDG